MAQVVVELSGDEAKLFRSYQRLIEQQRKLDEGHVKIKRSSKDAGQTIEQSFGQQAMGAMSAYALKITSVGAALGLLGKMISDVKRRSEELAQFQQTSFGGLGELAQLATSPKDMGRLVASARRLYTQGAAPDLNMAAQLQFAITSAGVEKYTREIGELQASGVVREVKTMVDSAAALEASMGVRATGGFAPIVSRAFGASMGAPARAEQILQAAALSGPQAKALGFNVSELLAAVATLAKPAGTAEQAGTFLESFTKQIEKQGITTGRLQRGRSLEQYVGDIAALESRGVGVRTILGNRQEAVTGYRLLRETMGAGTYGTNLTNVLEAERSNAFQQKVNYYRAIPTMSAERARRGAMARGLTADDAPGIYGNLATAIQEDMATRARERYGRFGEQLQRMGASIDRSFGGRQFVERWAQEATPETQEMVRETLEALRDLRGAAVNLENATESNRQRAAVAVQPE